MFLSSSRRSAGSRSSAFVPKLSTQDTISARLDALSERMSEPSGVRSMRCPSLQMRSPTYVGERIWSEGQRMERTPDGSLILSLKASSRAEIVSWVLSFGTNAELLEPADLREELRNISRNLSKCYGEKKD